MTMYEINSQIADRKRGWGVEPYGQKKCFFALPCSIAQITHHALTHWLLGNIVFYLDIKNNTLCVLPMSNAKNAISDGCSTMDEWMNRMESLYVGKIPKN